MKLAATIADLGALDMQKSVFCAIFRKRSVWFMARQLVRFVARTHAPSPWGQGDQVFSKGWCWCTEQVPLQTLFDALEEWNEQLKHVEFAGFDQAEDEPDFDYGGPTP